MLQVYGVTYHKSLQHKLHSLEIKLQRKSPFLFILSAGKKHMKSLSSKRNATDFCDNWEVHCIKFSTPLKKQYFNFVTPVFRRRTTHQKSDDQINFSSFMDKLFVQKI